MPTLAIGIGGGDQSPSIQCLKRHNVLACERIVAAQHGDTVGLEYPMDLQSGIANGQAAKPEIADAPEHEIDDLFAAHRAQMQRNAVDARQPRDRAGDQAAANAGIAAMSSVGAEPIRIAPARSLRC